MSDIIGSGDVEIILDGKPYTLKPSLEACMAISRIAGGLQGAVDRCARFDFDTICEIIGAGLNANPGQRQKMVPPLVYKTGTFALSAACILFIRVIGNGGTLPNDDEDAEEEQTDPLAASASQSSTDE